MRLRFLIHDRDEDLGTVSPRFDEIIVSGDANASDLSLTFDVGSGSLSASAEDAFAFSFRYDVLGTTSLRSTFLEIADSTVQGEGVLEIATNVSPSCSAALIVGKPTYGSRKNNLRNSNRLMSS